MKPFLTSRGGAQCPLGSLPLLWVVVLAVVMVVVVEEEEEEQGAGAAELLLRRGTRCLVLLSRGRSV
jgi:hypothetical protein